RQGGERHRPGARGDGVPLRERRRRRHAADADEAVPGDRLLGADLDREAQPRGGLGAGGGGGGEGGGGVRRGGGGAGEDGGGGCGGGGGGWGGGGRGGRGG